jgi:MFS transporter, DHA2 family, multidrug resistance protein
MAWSNEKYTIPEIHNKIDLRLKGWILIVFFLVFQFSGGVYMAAGAEMSGALSLLKEDIMMAGYASLVGLCLTFTIMYRLKARFTIKTSLITSAVVLILCNIASLCTINVPLLVGISFIAGIFRMWGTFACNTTLAHWIFPEWNMSRFQSYIQTTVMSFMLLSGLTTTYMCYYIKWEYMHLLMVGVLAVLIILTAILFRHHRPGKKFPLYGIDWMGAILWGATAMSIIFVLNYGEHYDWFNSFYIRIGVLFTVASLALNIWRASFVKRPYIDNNLWSFRNVRVSFALLAVVYILTGPSHILEHIYTTAILHYDELYVVSLNWIGLAGYAAGGVFALQTLAFRNWRYKTMILIAFVLIVGYLIIMYFIIDYNLPRFSLFLPVFLRSFGAVLVPMTLLTCIFKTIPFRHFFQALNMTTMVTACCGPLLGIAVVNKMFKAATKRNELFLSSSFDNMNHEAVGIPVTHLYGALKEHAMLVGVKEVYGWLCIAGLASILLYLVRESDFHPVKLLRSRLVAVFN